MNVKLAVLTIIILFCLAGCGGSSDIPAVNNQGNQTSHGTGTFKVVFQWAGQNTKGDIAASSIPTAVTNINIKVKNGYFYSDEKNITPPTNEAVFTNIPEGLIDAEFTAANGGTVYSHRKTDVSIISDETAEKAIYLGVTIGSSGSLSPAGTLVVNPGDTLYWYNSDGNSYTINMGTVTSGLINPGGIWTHTFSSGGPFAYNCVGTGTTSGIISAEPCLSLSEMALITGGPFTMGANVYDYEKPSHSVTVSSFYMGKYEITNKEYAAFLNENGNQSEKGFTWIDMSMASDPRFGIVNSSGTFSAKPGYESRPVVNVTWFGAVGYCNWLSGKHGLTPCYGPNGNRSIPSVWKSKTGYRLPTEAEWEYACRGGTATDYWWGENYPTASDVNLKANCWYYYNSGINTSIEEGNHTYIGYKVNPFGIYDITGNVWEWCSDKAADYTSGSQTNPIGPDTSGDEDTQRIIRGGGWYGLDLSLRSGYRGSHYAKHNGYGLGFRIVRNQ